MVGDLASRGITGLSGGRGRPTNEIENTNAIESSAGMPVQQPEQAYGE